MPPPMPTLSESMSIIIITVVVAMLSLLLLLPLPPPLRHLFLAVTRRPTGLPLARLRFCFCFRASFHIAKIEVACGSLEGSLLHFECR